MQLHDADEPLLPPEAIVRHAQLPQEAGLVIQIAHSEPPRGVPEPASVSLAVAAVLAFLVLCCCVLIERRSS